jgi:fumarate hydratase subunit beta
LAGLETGDKVLISGTVFTVRDASSKRLAADIEAGNPPVPLNGQLIFYMGPSPAKPGAVIGSAGPTTSARMDGYVKQLLDNGVLGFLGKGRRSKDALSAMRDAGAVYFTAVGGVGAYLSRRIKEADAAAYEELGPEAVYKLVLDDFPAIVAYDVRGSDLFEREWERWT